VRRSCTANSLLFLVLISVVLFTGCATGIPASWQKLGASETDLKRDKYECSQEARVGPVTGTDETRVFFYGQNKLAQVEANRLYRMCMEARGWSAIEPK
jgi:uncharacterized protein YbjT (DUF2867 family)